ncbi:MAG: SDR family oxidoreductase [Planctomycetales bacterium]|nr:SDR family oxidoreductase [Planctomycetales bacterium]
MNDVRRIVITGVSRGLGAALAESLLALGHRVYGCARSAAAVEKLNAAHAPRGTFAVVDVADAAAVDRWAQTILEDGGPPDLLLNSAAQINANTELWNVPPEEFHRLVDVNISGVFHVVRALLPAMIERGSGIVVNFTSTWGRTTSPEVAPYCATKWAVEGMTRALAQELPRGLAAVPLNPGVINTEMLQSCFGDGAASYPSPQQWAKKAVPLLLGLSAKDNGQPLTVPQ